MKIILGITLMLALSNDIRAQETFAGIYFDSSIPAYHTNALKNDFTYLFKSSFKEADTQLKPLTGISEVSGPHMFNWLYNRVKYIVGEDYHIWGRSNAITRRRHSFPKTPLPSFMSKSNDSFYGIVVMSNVGAELYLKGKRDKILRGIKLDRKDIFATSPRVGILKIGKGLFIESYLVNNELNSEANKIKRLGTLFHEARHSDGHSKHVGFHHDRCPSGHPLSGLNACESSSNGAYTTEAVTMKSLLLNCEACSIEDKTKLNTIIADSYSRVVIHSHVKTEKQLLEEIETYQRVVDFYVEHLKKNPNYEAGIKELDRLRGKLKTSQDQLLELKNPKIAEKLDPQPEGTFQETRVEVSSQFMKKSIGR